MGDPLRRQSWRKFILEFDAASKALLLEILQELVADAGEIEGLPEIEFTKDPGGTISVRKNGTAKIKLKIKFSVEGEKRPLNGKMIVKAAATVSEET